MRQKRLSSDFFSGVLLLHKAAYFFFFSPAVITETKFILCRDRKEGTIALGRALWGQHHFLTDYSTVRGSWRRTGNLVYYTLLDFKENMDNFEARTERVNFGLFQSNSDFT